MGPARPSGRRACAQCLLYWGRTGFCELVSNVTCCPEGINANLRSRPGLSQQLSQGRDRIDWHLMRPHGDARSSETPRWGRLRAGYVVGLEPNTRGTGHGGPWRGSSTRGEEAACAVFSPPFFCSPFRGSSTRGATACGRGCGRDGSKTWGEQVKPPLAHDTLMRPPPAPPQAPVLQHLPSLLLTLHIDPRPTSKHYTPLPFPLLHFRGLPLPFASSVPHLHLPFMPDPLPSAAILLEARPHLLPSNAPPARLSLLRTPQRDALLAQAPSPLFLDRGA